MKWEDDSMLNAESSLSDNISSNSSFDKKKINAKDDIEAGKALE